MDEHFGEDRQCPVEWTRLKECCLTLKKIARTHSKKRDCVEPGLEKRNGEEITVMESLLFHWHFLHKT